MLSKTEKAVATFSRGRDTPNKQRFEEDNSEGEAPLVGTLYLTKSLIDKDIKRITVTIEVDS